MKSSSSYTYKFTNGTFTISRGIVANKYDWNLSVSLTESKEGYKRFIHLDRTLFLTKKAAKEYAISLLMKFNLF